MAVDIQCDISFRGTAQWLDVYVTYEVLPPVSGAPAWHQA